MKTSLGFGFGAKCHSFAFFFIFIFCAANLCHADCVSPPAGIVSWWRGENNAADSSGTNNGVLEGSLTFAAAEAGQGFSMPQTNASLRIPASATLNVGTSNGFTVEAWIKPAGVTNLQPLFEWNTGSTVGDAWGVHFYISQDAGPGSLYANIVDSSQGWHSFSSFTNPIVGNAFQHVALTYDKISGVAKMYCNGVVVGQQTVGSFTPKTIGDLYLGRRPTAEKFGYIGLFDEATLYSRALSQSEIQSICGANVSGKCSSTALTLEDGLLLHYPFDANAVDTSGHGHDATNSGAVLSPDRFGSNNSAYAFNGLNNYMIVPDSAKALNFDARSNQYSVSLWVKLADTTRWQDLIIDRSSLSNGHNSYRLVFHPTYGFIAFCWDGTMNIEVASQTYPQSNQWYQVAMVVNARTVQLYVNGKQEGVPGEPNSFFTMPSDFGSTLNNETGRTIGRFAGTYYGNYLGGALDDIRIYGRALTTNEISLLYGGFLTVNVPVCTAAPTNIVSWWRTEGNGNDEVSGNTAVLQSGVTFGAGKVGQAMLLNNTNAYAVVAPSSSLNVGLGSGFTIEGWLNVSNVNGFHPICEWNDMAGNIGVALWIGTTPSSQGVLMGDPKTTNGVDNMIISPSGTLIANTWQHVALTYDKASGVGTIYVNGAIVGQQNIGSFTPQTSTTLVIGRRPTDHVGDWTYNTILGGKLDELSLYGRALSQAEIQAIYNADSAGKCPSIPAVAPSILTQPSDRTNFVGTTATFNVVANGTAPLKYQWRFESSPIAGATNAALTITNVQLTDAGHYSVLVTNVAGPVISSNATLTVIVPVCTPAPTNIVSWWRAEGNGNDEVNGNAAVLQSGVTFGAGKVGQAMLLNNTSAYGVVAPSPSLNVGLGSGFTIEGWINVSNVNGFHPICEWNDMTGNIGVALWIGTTPSSQGVLMGDPKTTNGIDNMIISPSGTLIANTWQHVALTYDKTSGVGTIYVNGAIVGQQNIGSFTPQTSSSLVIGRRPTDHVGDWTYNTILGGKLDELSLYGRALSQGEIQAIYNADSAGKCTPFPPSIITQPSSRTNNAGTAASFTVVAGGSAPLTYQWKFNDGNIPDATNSTLILPNVQMSDTGNYSVSVANGAGSALSGYAALAVVVPDCIPAPTNLVSWWRAESNANDTIGTNNGYAEGLITYTNGQVGEAFVFNDTNSEIIIPASPSLNLGEGDGFTLEAWINPSNVTQLHPIFEWNSGSSIGDAWGVHFYTTVSPAPGALYANIVDSSQGWHQISSTNGMVVPNAFQHVALTYDKASGIATIYRNGDIVAQQSIGTFTPKTTYDLHLGHRPTAEMFGFTGMLDEPAVFSRALNQAEIQSIYNAGVAGKCVPVYPPTISMQPTNQFAIAGDNVTFSVAATGTDPLSYHWSFNNSVIADGTNSSLTLSNVQNASEGTYSVTVTNLYGSATSSNAALVVDVPPVADASATTPLIISVNGSNATAVLDGTLSSDADGDPLHYVWLDAQTNSIATGAVAVVVLPVATNVITLVVSDGFVLSSNAVTIEVITIAQAVERLEGVVTSDVSKKNALLAILNAALASIDRSNPTAAINQLQAFQNQVKAQLAPLDPTLAQTLIDEAQSIIDAITGGGSLRGHAALAGSLQSNGKVHIKFAGAHQQTYIIEASTNLMDWEMIGVAKEQADGSFNFDDVEASQKSARFYRVVTIP